MDVWTEVADGRVRLADEADRLDPDALEAPSWCSGWRVRDVLGHLVYLAEASSGALFGTLFAWVRSRTGRWTVEPARWEIIQWMS